MLNEPSSQRISYNRRNGMPPLWELQKASSLAHCHSAAAKEYCSSLSHLLIQLLKSETMSSVLKTPYCQRILFWRTVRQLLKAHFWARWTQAEEKQQFHWNWGQNSMSATRPQPDHTQTDRQKLHWEGQHLQKWSVVWGCFYTNVSSWVSKTPQARNASSENLALWKCFKWSKKNLTHSQNF